MQIKPHVLVVSNHWGAKALTPSAGIFVDRQIAALEKAGVRVTTFDIGTSHSPIHIVTRWLELRRHVQRLNPDLVHAQYGTIIGFVSTFLSKPTVISYCGNDLRAGASVSKVRMYLGFFLSNMAALRARAMICKSAQLRQALWWCRHRAVVIPSGVDLDLFSPGPRKIARKELGWELEHPIVIFNVRNDPKNKGLDLATAAMQIVQSRIPGTELRLIENVEPNRMPLYYRAADVLLCASLSEGSPNVVKEALACDLPVVSTPVGDVHERLAGVQPSAVVARDTKAIGEALVKVLLERKRCNGRANVASLSSENIAQRVLGVYRTTLHDTVDGNSVVGKPRAEELTVVTIAEGGMLQEVAGLHLEAFAGYLNALLGRGYAKAFIKWFIKKEGTIAIAVIDGQQKVVGYALGAPVGYNRDLNRDLLWEVIVRIIIRPWVLFDKRFWFVFKARMRNLVGLPQNVRQVLDLPEPSMSLVAIGVAAYRRRSMIGQRLMRAFEDGAREFRMRSLILSVYENAKGSRRFYEKCGWQPYDGQVSKGGTILYSKVLQPSLGP